MKLYIGNKNYSSWSLRVWLTMKEKGIEFEEDLRPFDVENDYADFAEFSPTSKVPVLRVNDTTIWETLAILEYLAETFPNRGLWPTDAARRTYARCIANEMHAGFMALRAACPMNIRRRVAPIETDRLVRKDVSRIEAIWTDCLDRHGGPFLMGREFTIADGMYSPIVNRLHIYGLSRAAAVKRYSQTITSLESWREWEVASRAEPWTVDIDEVYA